MEIKRIANVNVDGHYDTKCIECGREIQLWWNGGELDLEECCGYLYYLEHSEIDFVVSK